MQSNMETKILSINNTAKLFNFPRNKLYDLVNAGKVPYIELVSISGNKRRVINTRVFEKWLEDLANGRKTI